MNSSRHRQALEDFDNLSRRLALEIYRVRYVPNDAARCAFAAEMGEAFEAEGMSLALRQMAGLIGARVLDSSHCDYEVPAGASSALLLADGHAPSPSQRSCSVAHLDKSHIAIHTYPDIRPERDIATLRADLTISTCGRIRPLSALPFVLYALGGDAIIIESSVRGFTRDEDGEKVFADPAMQPEDPVTSWLPGPLQDTFQGWVIPAPDTRDRRLNLLRRPLHCADVAYTDDVPDDAKQRLWRELCEIAPPNDAEAMSEGALL